jgi:hypothetical protein
MSNNTSLSNYGFGDSPEKQSTDLSSREDTRAMHEVQAAFVIAKKFPRNESEAFAKIMKACKRPFLAEQAMYAYPKGGKVVEGASIRMAETLLACWGNCDAGIKEISQANGVSIAEAYAIDLETNTRITKIFHVPHTLGTKNGPKKLTDPRDIYELVANQGARRMRACILAVIPGDIVDAALEECKKTLTNGAEPLADRIRKIVMAFDDVGVKVEHLEKRLGHNLDATIEAEVVTLRSIYKSLKDGMAKREDFFEMGSASSTNKNINDLISEKKNIILETKEDSKEAEVINTETGEILQPQSASNTVNHETLKKQLERAKSIDTLDIAADLIKEVRPDKKEELTNLYHKRREELK